MLKEMFSEGSKISSKRVSLLVLLVIVTVSYYAEQFLGSCCDFKIDNEKFGMMITLTEVALWTVLGDKLPDIAGGLSGMVAKKKKDVEPIVD